MKKNISTWSSSKIKEKMQEILYANANQIIDKDNIDYYFVYDTLLKHPQASVKIGAGVDYFYVQRSKWKFNQFNFMIKRVDGTDVDFSFNKCIQKAPVAKRNWNIIFREIVKSQIDDFRNKAFEVVGSKDKFLCSQTGLKFKKIYSHVDHVFPLTFESIYLEFIEQNNLKLDDILLTEDLGTSETVKIIDEDIRNSFFSFHKERAVLRIVCSSANLQAKRTKDYDGLNPELAKYNLLEQYPQYHIDKNIE